MVPVRCPKCRHKFSASLEGTDAIVCPNCQGRLAIPPSVREKLLAAANRAKPEEPPAPSESAAEPEPNPVPVPKREPTLPREPLQTAVPVQPAAPLRVPEPTPAPTPAPKPKRRKPVDIPRDTLSAPLPSIDMEELIDMTAMVDIVFFLLIFFLVTSMSVVHSSSKLPQPNPQEGSSGSSPSQVVRDQAERDEAVLTISKEDVIELDGTLCQDQDDLVMRLGKRRTEGSAETSLLIVGHGDATHGTLATVLDAAYETGFNRLRFAVKDDFDR